MIPNTSKLYCCKSCGWTGNESQLEWDNTETCMGPDKIEVCPKCGSPDVVTLKTTEINKKPLKE
jgi:hypothetical protein